MTIEQQRAELWEKIQQLEAEKLACHDDAKRERISRQLLAMCQYCAVLDERVAAGD